MLTSINSTYFVLCIGIAKLMFIMILANHVLACVWYAVGRASPNGWAHGDVLLGEDILYRYFTAMHWALTQFQGTSDILPGGSVNERTYAVGTVVLALLGLSAFVSSLTNLMM